MILASPESLVITSKEYGAFEVQKLIKIFTLRGFYYVIGFLVVVIISVFAFASREKNIIQITVQKYCSSRYDRCTCRC